MSDEIDDGVIKFRLDWTQAPTPPFAAELLAFREKCFAKHWIGEYSNGIGFGNISLKSSSKAFTISGSQTGRLSTTQTSDYVLVDQYNINQNSLHCTGTIQASSESLTHAALYEYDDSIQAVIHIHHLSLWEKYLNVLPTTQAQVPYGTPVMAKEMWRLFEEADLQQHKCLIMAGHKEGILAFGKTLDEAFAVLEAL